MRLQRLPLWILPPDGRIPTWELCTSWCRSYAAVDTSRFLSQIGNVAMRHDSSNLGDVRAGRIHPEDKEADQQLGN